MTNKQELKQISLLSMRAARAEGDGAFSSRNPAISRQTEVIRGYSVALVDTACDVTSEVTECESGVCLCRTNRAAGLCFKQAGGECSTVLRCPDGKVKGSHGHSGNTTH